jgi:hypothetical protein
MNSEDQSSAIHLANQPLHGSTQKKTLTDIMDELSHAKSGIINLIQDAQVRLSPTPQNNLMTETKRFRQVDTEVHRVIDGRLSLAEVLEEQTIEGKSAMFSVFEKLTRPR